MEQPMIRERLIRLFEYIRETKLRTEKKIRRVEEYPNVWWLEDLLHLPGVDYSSDLSTTFLTVRRPEIPDSPPIPDEIMANVIHGEHPDQEPKWIEDPDWNEAEHKYKEHLYQTWLQQSWRLWAESNRHLYRAKQFYDELFSLYNRLQDEGGTWEFVCGVGLLSWMVQGDQIRRHVITSQLDIHFQAEQGAFHLYSSPKGTSVDTDAVFPYLQSYRNIPEWMDQIDESLDPRDSTQLETLLEELVKQLDEQGAYRSRWQKLVPATSNPMISYSPALIVRKTASSVWQLEYTRAIDYLQAGGEIPLFLQKLVTLDEIPMDINQLARWNTVGTDVYFPLPYNTQQKEIVNRLIKHDAVVVQGPPGTGKSHTIANLICHLLAQGKKVLVTSEKERALEVLGQKIPNGIRELCVQVLGGDARDVSDLERSVRRIAESFEQKDVVELGVHVEKLQRELAMTRKVKERLLNQMRLSAEQEHETRQMGRFCLKPQTAIQWLQEHQEANWFPDRIKEDRNFLLTSEDIVHINQFTLHVSKKDRLALVHHRPTSKQLPTPSSFEHVVQEYQALQNEMSTKQQLIQDWKVSNSFSHLIPIALNKLVSAQREFKRISNEPWKISILRDSLQGGESRGQWEELVFDFEERLRLLNDLERNLLEYQVSSTSTIAEAEMYDDVVAVIERYKENKSVGPIFMHLIGRKYAYLFRDVLINGKHLREREDFELLRSHLEREELRNRVVLKWNRLMGQVNGEKVDLDTPRFVLWLHEQIEQIRLLLSFSERVIQPFQSIIQAFGIPEVDWLDTRWYEQIMAGLQTMQRFVRLEELRQLRSKWLQVCSIGAEQAHAHELWNQLIQAIQAYDITVYRVAYKEMLRLEEMEPLFQGYQEALKKVAPYAPQWARQLMELEEGTGIGKTYEKIEEAWVYSQCKTWMEQHLASKPLVELEEEYKLEEQREFRLIQQIVVDLAWKYQLERTTDRQKRSLISWLQFIKKIGKGRGKYSNKYKQEASKEMEICREAIPVWIMPIQRVIENIEIANAFDVIIMDESSQSTLYALSVLLRGQKVIIVGDDRQISPDPVGVEKSINHELIETYLSDIPQAGQFEISTSIYDTANRVVQQRIILKEHFRSVPEIIQFSNQYMYDGQIVPLRYPQVKEKLESPIQAIRVPSSTQTESGRTINRAEAEAIVRKIKACCLDQKYAKKTIGVISLQGFEQAKLIESLLRDELGEEEFLRRKIVCGDSYRLQGDERDIIFLSLVVTPHQRIGVLAEDKHRRRFNVAVSRGRDQVFLFHSVDLTDLHPACVRTALLEYFLHMHPSSREGEEHESLFITPLEREIFQLLISKGYKVRTHVPVGNLGRTIDLVIDGGRSRLAVQCDGDREFGPEDWQAEFEHQQVLERVGWNFTRVRGSSFYHDPAKAMEAVYRKLDELKIYPSVQVESMY